VPATLCIGGQTYTLTDHDEFDQDSTLSIADPIGSTLEANNNWNGGTNPNFEWTDTLQWSQVNNDHSDDAYSPTLAQTAAWGIPNPRTLDPGVGVVLSAYPVPSPMASGEETALCADGVCRGHISGLLADPKSAATGYWVFSAEVPNGNGWWPALWSLDNGDDTEYDAMEENSFWWGNDVVQQTEQNSGGSEADTQITLPTLSTAFHTYAYLVTSSNVGFYADNVAQSNFPRYHTSAVNTIMNIQICKTGSQSYCNTAPAATATAQMTVKYYRHYAPPATSDPCLTPYDVPALPT